MTKQHFEAIAAILGRYHIDNAAEGFDMGYADAGFGITSDLADYFESVNPRFDREKFIAAVRA